MNLSLAHVLCGWRTKGVPRTPAILGPPGGSETRLPSPIPSPYPIPTMLTDGPRSRPLRAPQTHEICSYSAHTSDLKDTACKLPSSPMSSWYHPTERLPGAPCIVLPLPSPPYSSPTCRDSPISAVTIPSPQRRLPGPSRERRLTQGRPCLCWGTGFATPNGLSSEYYFKLVIF